MLAILYQNFEFVGTSKMPRTIKALILEDQAVWQDVHEASLRLGNGRCLAFTYDKVDEALEALHTEPFHLVIVDLQLNANDPEEKRVDEFEGYRLITQLEKYGWLDKMVICVVSFWSDIARLAPFLRRSVIEIDTARRSLASGVEIDGVIYFSKNEFQNDKFWNRVQRELVKKGLWTERVPQQREILEVLTQRMSRNMIEHIESTAEHSKLASEDEWLKLFYNHYGEKGIQNRIRMEIADLLMRWMEEVKAEDIDLSRVGSGFSKATVIKAHRMLKDGWELPVIIKMGYHREIENERAAYNNVVRRSVLRVPPAQDGPRTFLLSAQIYDFVHEGRSFDEEYHQADKIEDLEKLIEDLAKNCGNWYGRKYQKVAHASEYMSYLHAYLPRFEAPIKHLQEQTEAGGEIFWERPRIHFPMIHSEFANPLLLLDSQGSFANMRFPAMRSMTHGDFNANNILIRHEQSWLIDFGRTEDSHAMRDFIQLEAVVKFVLLRGASLEERYELEKALLRQNHFEEIDTIRQSFTPNGDNAARIERAFRLVCKIREVVWASILNREIGSPVGDFGQYEMGLFFLSLNSVRFIKTKAIPDGIEPLHALHALMSAAMIGEKLNS